MRREMRNIKPSGRQQNDVVWKLISDTDQIRPCSKMIKIFQTCNKSLRKIFLILHSGDWKIAVAINVRCATNIPAF